MSTSIVLDQCQLSLQFANLLHLLSVFSCLFVIFKIRLFLFGPLHNTNSAEKNISRLKTAYSGNVSVAQVTAQEEKVFPRFIKQGSAFNTERSHHGNKHPMERFTISEEDLQTHFTGYPLGRTA